MSVHTKISKNKKKKKNENKQIIAPICSIFKYAISKCSGFSVLSNLFFFSYFYSFFVSFFILCCVANFSFLWGFFFGLFSCGFTIFIFKVTEHREA